MSKILIVYYSRKGENYWNGSIKSIAKGNTERVAEFIQKNVGGDLFEVETVRSYSESYMTCIDEAKQELREKARPEIKAYPDKFDEYDTIFVGYPNWWGDWLMIMYTFFENEDLSGKTLVPFSTHAGSGLSEFDSKLSAACPASDVLEGLAVTGADAQNNPDSVRSTVDEWLSGIGY